jgi:hypothetical protein
MNLTFCPHEMRVSQSARTGVWDDSTKAHAKECAHCREIVQITEWLGSEVRSNEGYKLPDAEQVWLNSRYFAIQEAREKALRPLLIAERVIRVALLLIIAGGLAWISYMVPSLLSDWLPKHPNIPQPIHLTSVVLITCLAAFLAAKLAQPILTEE